VSQNFSHRQRGGAIRYAMTYFMLSPMLPLPMPLIALLSHSALGVASRTISVHFCLCAEVEGAVGLDALRSALDQVRERHPIMRARIVDDEQVGASFYKSDAPIEIEATVIGIDGDWRPAVEHELRKPMGVGVNALMRATALYSAETTAIVLTFHHAVADGMSAIWVLDDPLRAQGGERLEAVPFSPTIEDAILKPGFTTICSPQVDRSVPFSLETQSSTPMVSDSLRTHIATSEFSRDETARLIERCRANDTTVHGAICAAASLHVPASELGTVRWFARSTCADTPESTTVPAGSSLEALRLRRPRPRPVQ
jgi:Condensation domain